MCLGVFSIYSMMTKNGSSCFEFLFILAIHLKHTNGRGLFGNCSILFCKTWFTEKAKCYVCLNFRMPIMDKIVCLLQKYFTVH